MPDSTVLARLQEALAAPDAMEVLAAAVPALGPWAGSDFRRQIWYLRRKARLTQQQLAERSGVTQARLSRIEKGAAVKLSTLIAIFEARGHDLLIVPGPLGKAREGRPTWRNEGKDRSDRR